MGILSRVPMVILDSARLAEISYLNQLALPLHCQLINVPVVQRIGH